MKQNTTRKPSKTSKHTPRDIKRRKKPPITEVLQPLLFHVLTITVTVTAVCRKPPEHS